MQGELCDTLAGLSLSTMAGDLGWDGPLHCEPHQALGMGMYDAASAASFHFASVTPGNSLATMRLAPHRFERESAYLHAHDGQLFSKEPAHIGSNTSWQAKVLKIINTFHTKEELLAYVSSVHSQLDEINLVTVIYRLARLYSAVRSPPARRRWSSELLSNATFQLLLGAIQTHLLLALQLIGNSNSTGRRIHLDARGVSNLLWAVVKLELGIKPGGIGNDLLHTASPIVLHVLPNSSSQGLANLLWAYSKLPMPTTHIKVMMAISAQMTIRLRDETERFDAQALSNSIWALAHVRVPVADMDAAAGSSGSTLQFMLGIAARALGALGGLHTCAAPHRVQASMQEAERRFSAQALVNICWGFASLLEQDCSKVPAIRMLFSSIRAEALIRLQATATALQLDQQWMVHFQGGFNEQALSNIIYAFEKARLLDTHLLQLVYDVAALRLDMTHGFSAMFKSQEICTLLRAVHLNLAQPWFFLTKLRALLLSFPHVIQSWSPAERLELDRALAMLEVYDSTCFLRQLQVQEQQQAMQDQVSSMMFGMAPGSFLLDGPTPVNNVKWPGY